MEKTIKIISTLMIVVMIMMVATPVFATTTAGAAASGVIDSLNEQANENPTSMSNFYKIAGKILSFLRNASYILGVIVLVVLGIKYMMGSLEEKAEYKKTLIPLVVGIVIVVSSTTIAKFLFDAFAI